MPLQVSEHPGVAGAGADTFQETTPVTLVTLVTKGQTPGGKDVYSSVHGGTLSLLSVVANS